MQIRFGFDEVALVVKKYAPVEILLKCNDDPQTLTVEVLPKVPIVGRIPGVSWLVSKIIPSIDIKIISVADGDVSFRFGSVATAFSKIIVWFMNQSFVEKTADGLVVHLKEISQVANVVKGFFDLYETVSVTFENDEICITTGPIKPCEEKELA